MTAYPVASSNTLSPKERSITDRANIVCDMNERNTERLREVLCKVRDGVPRLDEAKDGGAVPTRHAVFALQRAEEMASESESLLDQILSAL